MPDTNSSSVEATATTGPIVVAFADITPDMIDLVGGKGLGLGRMMATGEHVPDGFCVSTVAHRLGEVPRDAVLDAYRAMGRGTVAVRSSATAEDLADASFAGQQDTYLNIEGEDALIDAIERCWESLHNERATAYRDAIGWEGDVSMAVVVQKMIDPRAAGVLFTANPMTGTRTEMVIDATAGLGDVIVDGSVEGDHYVLVDGVRPEAHGCLTEEDQRELREIGRRLEQYFGAPQDIEFAFDEDGLWMLQSRAITTLFPVPEGVTPDDTRAYVEVGHMQGFLKPFTPMGMSSLVDLAEWWMDLMGMPEIMESFMVDVAGHLFMDLTPLLRNKKMRDKLSGAMDVYGADINQYVERLLKDPRFAPRKEKLISTGTVVKKMLPMLPKIIWDLKFTVMFPARARRIAYSWLDRMYHLPKLADDMRAAERIPAVNGVLGPVIGDAMMPMLGPLWVALGSRVIAEKLLGDVVRPGEMDAISRGMPYNPTTMMDLALWEVATKATRHGKLFLETPPEELTELYRSGDLPEIGLDSFMEKYGYRASQEIDLGVPRWVEDPTPVFYALAGYLRVTDPEMAPDVRYERAAEEAEAKVDELVGRATRTRPVRARIASFVLRRYRALAGLRELPKFAWVVPLLECRRQMLLLGGQLAEQGSLDKADDAFFLTNREAQEAAENGTDHSALARQRRAAYDRECRRTRLPVMILSDGTMPEAVPDPDAPVVEENEHLLVGKPAAAGKVTGRVRVVTDPRTATMEPGDILVAPTTDPGWTPLFLTAGGLVTNTGTPIAHGPTVAREYGIPAVICVRGATDRLKTGQLITIDGSTGTVEVHDGD